MMTKLPRTQALGMATGDHPFRIPSASATDRSPPLTPPKSGAWMAQANGTRTGPSTLGGLRLLAKRPRRRRRERLQGFNRPFEIRDTGQTRSPARDVFPVVKCVPAKPDHRLDDNNRPLKTRIQPVINNNQLPITWPV